MTAVREYLFAGGTAVLTGAASGIGAALADALAARQSHLALVDRDAAGVERVAARVRSAQPGLSVTVHVADLSETDRIPELARAVLAAHPRVTLLVNNAGVALGGRVSQTTMDDFDWVLDINLRAGVALTHALLPELRRGAHIVNVSSIFGIIAPAGQAAYAASKFGIRGFSEALRHELAPEGIGVTTVHPGGIATAIAANARMGAGVDEAEAAQGRRAIDALLSIPAATAAAAIVTGVRRRRPRVLIGATATVPDLLARLLPGSYGRVLAVLQRGQRT